MNLHTDPLRPKSRTLAGVRATPMPLMPSLQRRRLQCYLAMLLADGAMILASFALSGYIYMAQFGVQGAVALAQLLMPVFLVLALYNGAYSIDALARMPVGVSRVLMALVVSAAVVLFIAFFTKSSTQVSRAEFGLGVIASGMALLWERRLMRGFVRWRCGAGVLNELVIDDGGPEVALDGAYQVSAERFGLKPDLNDPHALHRIGLALRNADRVVVSSPPERREAWAIILKGASVAGDVIDEAVAQLSAQGARRVGRVGLLQVSVGPLGMRAQVTKRLFDLAIASVALVLLMPLLLLVALAIKLEDGGPVFFVQRRVGRSNRFFAMFKFRSMQLNQAGRDGGQSASREDGRITRVGRFIRCTSIDELPQLINVLLGDMSIVGPRPHAIGSQAGAKLFWEVDARYWQRHALKPGLTGLAQVRGLRGATDSEADLIGRLSADLEYLDGWSLWRDIGIILATFRVLVHDRAF